MNNILKVSLIVVAVLAIAGGLLFAGGMFASRWNQQAVGVFPGGTMMGRGNGPAGGGRGPGGGMMDGRGGGRGNMPGWNRNQANTTPLTVAEAKKAAQDYVTALKIDGLQLGEVMIFDNNAYVVVKETASGNGAFELLVDPFSKSAYPEQGADMMWNLKYGGVVQNGKVPGQGMMGGRGGMMNGWNSQNATPAAVSADMPISADQAVKDAQAFLDKAYPGATAATDPTRFYGYYSLDFSKDGKVVGMVSVNGFNGQVLPHTWHGTFIQESK